MAGYYGIFLVEWVCLKPEVYREIRGCCEWTGNNVHSVREDFLAKNPDYRVVDVVELKD